MLQLAVVIAVIIIVSYLYGALPVGLILGKLTKGIDIREYGSGNIGAANAQRVLGSWAFVIVFLVDISKGAFAVLLARYLLDVKAVEIAAALVAIAGHNWPVYLGFRGGKGVSTSLGAIAVMTPWVALVCLLAAGAVIGIIRYMSLGSIIGGLVFVSTTIVLAILGQQSVEYDIFAVVVMAMILFQHRDNIDRLRKGTESKIGQRAERRQEALSGDAPDGGIGKL